MALLHLVPLLLARLLCRLALLARLLAVPLRGGATIGIVGLEELGHLVPQHELLGRCQQRRTVLRISATLPIARQCLGQASTANEARIDIKESSGSRTDMAAEAAAAAEEASD